MNVTIILLILLVGSIATFLSTNRLARITAMIFSVASFVFTIAFVINASNVPYSDLEPINQFFNPLFKIDGLSLSLSLLTTFLLPLIILTGTSKSYQQERYFYSLVMFTGFAILGTFVSGHALLYYIFWELSLIPILILVILWGNGKFAEKRRSAMTFFIQTFLGSMFMLIAILFLYSKTESFNIQTFYAIDLRFEEQVFVFLAFFLAYAIKAPIFPFHTWQADIYMRAPSVGTMLLSGLMSKMAVFSILRWQIPITPDASDCLRPYVIGLCIISVLYGLIIAIRQDNMKRFFAYISMSHVGFIAAGVYTLTFIGLEGSMLLIIAHSLVIVGLFYIVDLIYIRTEQSNINELGGIRNVAGKFSFIFFLFVLAAISFPLTFNFIGELNIMIALYSFSNQIAYSIIIGLSLILGAYVMLRNYQLVSLGKKQQKYFDDLNFKEGLILGLILSAIIFFGFYSEPFVNLMNATVNEIMFYIN